MCPIIGQLTMSEVKVDVDMKIVCYNKKVVHHKGQVTLRTGAGI